MIKFILISAFLFLLGNIFYSSYGEPKLFFVPLALMIALFFTDATIHHWKGDYITRTTLIYFTALSYGWILKQSVYNETFNFYHDYIWGTLATGGFIVMVIVETIRHKKKIRDLKDTISKMRK